MNDIKHTIIFPTFITYSDYPDIIDIEIVEKSKQLILDYNDKPFAGDCVSTVRTKDDVLDASYMIDIKKAVVNTVWGYCQRLSINTENLVIKSSWINFYDKHQYQDLHSHSNSVLSGVFYIQSDGSSDLLFQAPWHFQQPVSPKHTNYNFENCHIMRYESKIGRCYVFPSHLLHQTLPAKSERISLAFNVNYVD